MVYFEEDGLGGRIDDYVADGDAADEERWDQGQERPDRLALLAAHRWDEEGVELVEEDRQRQDDRPVGGDGHRRRERFGHPEGDQAAVVRRKGPGRKFEQQVVLPEAEGEGDAEDCEGDDQP